MLDPLFPLAAVVIFGAGAYMVSDLAFFDWDLAWVSVSIGALIFAVVLGGGYLSRQLGTLVQAADAAVESEGPNGPVPGPLRHALLNPLIFAAENITDLLVIALAYIMIDKPNLAGALAAVLVAVAVGAMLHIPAQQRQARAARTGTAAGD